jgi:hypothetical protein
METGWCGGSLSPGGGENEDTHSGAAPSGAAQQAAVAKRAEAEDCAA